VASRKAEQSSIRQLIEKVKRTPLTILQRCPHGRAEHADSGSIHFDFNRVALQEEVWRLKPAPEEVPHLNKVLSVVFVIAGNEDHGTVAAQEFTIDPISHALYYADRRLLGGGP